VLPYFRKKRGRKEKKGEEERRGERRGTKTAVLLGVFLPRGEGGKKKNAGTGRSPSPPLGVEEGEGGWKGEEMAGRQPPLSSLPDKEKRRKRGGGRGRGRRGKCEEVGHCAPL